jgi:hypothetical protein
MVRQALAAADGHIYTLTATAPHELTKGQQRFVNERRSITTVDPVSPRDNLLAACRYAGARQASLIQARSA